MHNILNRNNAVRDLNFASLMLYPYETKMYAKTHLFLSQAVSVV